MSIQFLLHAGLVIHIIGMTTLAGVTLASLLTSRQFKTQYALNKERGSAILLATSRLPTIAGIGLLLLILSGITMMAATGGGYGQQLWFKIKMIFVLLVIASGIFLRRMFEKKLRAWVVDDLVSSNRSQEIERLTGRINFVQLFLLTFLVVIFTLSVFKYT